MSQLALPLAWPPEPGDDDFLVSPANARAVQLLEHWGAWPVRTALLVGPRRSGRSLLGRIMAAKSGGILLDDADRRPEEELFHGWNRAQAENRPLVMVAELAPPGWPIRLQDVRSRLSASPVARISPPDDVLTGALLVRGFARRRLDARPELIEWLSVRLDRNYLVIEQALDAIEQAATGRRRRLSIPLARATMAEAGLVTTAASRKEIS